MPERLAAQLETRIFYFTVENQKDSELSILMYNTPYTLVSKEDKWENHAGNKMTMSPALIDAVIATAYHS